MSQCVCFCFYHLNVASFCLLVNFCDFFFHFYCYFFKFTAVYDNLLICMDCISFRFSVVLTEQDSATDSKGQALCYADEHRTTSTPSARHHTCSRNYIFQPKYSQNILSEGTMQGKETKYSETK